MTIEEANRIWEDCYGSTDPELWARYTTTQRVTAIEVRDRHHNGNSGQWGIWHISDRD